MTKLIIYIPGKPSIHGFKRREFLWSAIHECHIFMGREYDAAEFNDAYAKVMKTNRDMNPMVKVVQAEVAAVAAPAPVAPLAPPPIVDPSTPLAQSREITVDEAEEVLLRLAPERLKKKTGRMAVPEQIAV